MRWQWCRCDIRFLVRLNRNWWMRFFPGRRHYYCATCERHAFLARHSVRAALPTTASSHLAADETSHSPLTA